MSSCWDLGSERVLAQLQSITPSACTGMGADDRSQGQRQARVWLQGLAAGMRQCRPLVRVRTSLCCMSSCGGLRCWCALVWL